MNPIHFSYETVKYVSVNDSRLGCLRLLLVVAIVLYVVVVEMAYMGGYLEAIQVVGASRFSLKQPTTNNCDFSDSNNCTNAFAPLDTLAYCQQNGQGVPYSGTVFPCQIYEAVNAQVIQESSIVVWTRASTKNETLICGSGEEMICPRTYQSTSDSSVDDTFYIAESEAFTILLEHAATASHICETKEQKMGAMASQHYTCSAQASMFPEAGRVLSQNDKLCELEFQENKSYSSPIGSEQTKHAPCYIAPNRTNNGRDVFSLDAMLQAAGVTLDDCAVTGESSTEEDRDDGKCITYRQTGAMVLITIVWNDFLPYRGLCKPFYFYKPRVVAQSFKGSQAFYSEYRTSRILMDAHGIKLSVVTAGSFHHFTWLNFLITITTALGMLAVATAIVDACMLYILPEKEQYQQVKYESIRQESTDQSPPSHQVLTQDEDCLSESNSQSDLREPLLTSP
eukprot:scaffold13293_cov120-Cylindrotheca_fusiformis.AAC.8